MGFALASMHSPDVKSVSKQKAALDSLAVGGPSFGLGFWN